MAAKTIAFVNKDDAGSTVRTFNLPFSKFDATAAPGVSDDDAAGYVAGSIWADRTNHKIYVCKDNSTGAAVWSEIPGSGGGGSGTVTNASNLTDNAIVRGDGGTVGAQTSGVIIDDSDNVTGMASLVLPYNTLKLLDSDASHTLAIVNSSNLTGNRQLSIATNDADRTLTFTGDFAMSGSHNLTVTITGDTNVTFPTSGVLINEARFDKVSPAAIQNLGFDVSASAGALTISVKTNAAGTPSSTDYCVIPFRYTTTYAGYTRYRKITSSMSLTIPSGATLGTANGKACRVWIGAIDSMVDAFPETGTVQLFAINCYDGSGTIYPLRDHMLANPTAIGTGSDYAGAMYSTSTVSGVARAIRILGYLEWPSGLSTAGTWTWASSNEILQMYAPGVPLPGDVVQSPIVVDATGMNITGTIPVDDTIPQSSEGEQILSLAIAPTSAANLLRVSCFAMLSENTNNTTPTVALFRDSGADSISAMWNYVSGIIPSGFVPCFAFVLAGSTSSTTFKARAGSYAGTTYYNRHSAARYYGGVMQSHLRIEEVQG